MLSNEIGINRFMTGYCRMLSADIADERFADQPLPGVNHPAWILGHLSVTADAAVALLGGAKSIPAEWGPLFGPGSKISADRAAYPSKGELLRVLEDLHARARDLAACADSERISRPNPNDRFRSHLPTIRDAVAFILTAHLGVHLGQFSAWRRMAGLPPLF